MALLRVRRDLLGVDFSKMRRVNSRKSPPEAKSELRSAVHTRPGIAGLRPSERGTMELQDKTLTCRDCSSTFIFTAGEQGFYIEKGLMNEPQRCPGCRANRRR